MGVCRHAVLSLCLCVLFTSFLEVRSEPCWLSLLDGSEYNTEDSGKRTNVKEAGLIKSGTGIYVTCLEGYDLVAFNGGVKSVDNAQLVMCENGKWENVHICKKRITCNPPIEVQNAILREQFRNKSIFEEGEVVQYDCNLGYSIYGSSRERNCTATGWSEVYFQCNVVRCPYIPDPEHGRRLDGNNEAGLSTHFSCNLGYRLVGPSMFICTVGGEWSPRGRPRCDRIVCPELGYLRNGNIFQATNNGLRNNYQSVAEYTCNNGYSINGTRSRTAERECQADRTWTGYDFFCEAARPSCSHLENGKVTENYEKYKVECNEGYELNLFKKDELYCTCVAEGLLCKYVSQTPFCEPASCVPHCKNGGVCVKNNKCRCPNLTSGSACEDILCDEECKLNGGKCLAPGKCENCPPGRYGENCEKRGCRMPIDEHRLSPNENWVPVQWSVSGENMICRSGYRSSSVDTMTCLEAGEWSQLIQCEEIPKIRYRIQMKTGSARWAETTADVYIYLRDSRSSSGKLIMRNRPRRGEIITEEFRAENLTPFKEVVVGRGGVWYKDDWQLDYVAITDLIHSQYYIFKKIDPVWIDDDIDVTIPLFARCDKKCPENGGLCVSENTCKCPAGNHGTNCEDRGCLYPENTPLRPRKKNTFSEGEIISGDDFDCLPSQRPEPPSMTCLKNGSWTKTTSCVDTAEKVRYIVQVKTASDHPDAGSYTNVFVKLHGENGRSTGEHRVGGLYYHIKGALVEDSFEDVDISAIQFVTVRRQDGDQWLLEYVSVAVDIGDPKKYKSYYSFGESRPQWIQNNKPTKIYRMTKECFEYQPYIDPFKHNDRRDVRYFDTSPTEPESYCKTQCLLSKELSCKGVFFNKYIDTYGRQGVTCAAFSETDQRDFSANYDKGLAKYFHRTC